MERTQDNLTQNKNSFLMYLDHITVIDALSNEDAGMLIKALYHYASGNGNPKDLSPVANVVFLMMQSQMKLDLKKWRETCVKNKQNIKKRWNKKNTNVYKRIPSDTKNTDNEYEKDNDTDNEYENVFNKTIDDFKKHRKQLKKPMTEKAVSLLLTKLDTIANSEEEKIQILNQSIENGWQGIFPLKETQKQKNEPFDLFKNYKEKEIIIDVEKSN